MITDYPFLPLVLEKFRRFDSSHRFILGIVGPPASGKSFLAEQLPGLINERSGEDICSHVSMDGYHYHNDHLTANGLYPHEGSHFTFDVKGFIQKLIEIKEEPGAVSCPVYIRKDHNPVEKGHIIRPRHRIVIAEGNYLLLTVFPWISIRHILDFSICLDVDPQIQWTRLMDRHTGTGKTEKEAANKILITDLPNTDIILRDKKRADCLYLPPGNFP